MHALWTEAPLNPLHGPIFIIHKSLHPALGKSGPYVSYPHQQPFHFPSEPVQHCTTCHGRQTVCSLRSLLLLLLLRIHFSLPHH